MRNSAISKNNQTIFIKPLSISDHIVKEENQKLQGLQKNHQIPIVNQSKSSKGLFKKFRDSVQVQKPPQIPKQNLPKRISFSHEHNTPLLKIMKKQETCFEPNSSDMEEHKENSKLQLHSKKFLDFSQNIKHSASRFKNQFHEQYHKNNQINTNHFNYTPQPEKDESFNFGHGLEGIDLGQLESTFPQKNTGLFGGLKDAKQFGHASSIFTPMPSNVSGSKKLPKRVSDAQMRTTGRNFFKRPSNLTVSQDFLKTMGSQGRKGDKRQGANMNSSISRFRNRESRVSSEIKRSSSQVRSTTNSFNVVAQLLANSKNRTNKQGSHLSLASNLTRLLFKYNGGHATTLYNYRLKIKNQSAVRLSIKIKCTSPRSYEVRPSTETVLNPLQIFNVSIELKLFTHDLNHTTMKHDLSRYHSDKFQIIYWTTDEATQEEYFDGEKLLPVVIEQTQEEKARNTGFQQNSSNQKIKQATQERQIQMYKKLIQKNKQKVQEVDMKISVLNSHQFKHAYFTKHLFWSFAFIGITLGFWFA